MIHFVARRLLNLDMFILKLKNILTFGKYFKIILMIKLEARKFAIN
jgi:hypothetical protein